MEDYILEGVSDVGDVSHLLGTEPVPVVHLKVVPVRPFSTGTVAVVRIVLDGQIVLCCPLKVWETDHLAQKRELSDADIGNHVFEACLRPVQEGPSSEDAVSCNSCGTKQEGRTHGLFCIERVEGCGQRSKKKQTTSKYEATSRTSAKGIYPGLAKAGLTELIVS